MYHEMDVESTSEICMTLEANFLNKTLSNKLYLMQEFDVLKMQEECTLLNTLIPSTVWSHQTWHVLRSRWDEDRVFSCLLHCVRPTKDWLLL
jgi:hypothetical protein